MNYCNKIIGRAFSKIQGQGGSLLASKKNRLVKWDTSRQGSEFFMKLIKPIFYSLNAYILCSDVAEQEKGSQNKVLKFFTLISHG